jgi:exonuclease VII small subunit
MNTENLVRKFVTQIDNIVDRLEKTFHDLEGALREYK